MGAIQIGKFINAELLKVLPNISINPILEPENADTVDSYIVYRRISLTPDYTKDGIVGNDIVEEINIMSKAYTTGVDIAQLVRDCFELKTGSYSNTITIYQCELLPVPEESTDGVIYIQSLQFEFLTN